MRAFLFYLLYVSGETVYARLSFGGLPIQLCGAVLANVRQVSRIFDAGFWTKQNNEPLCGWALYLSQPLSCCIKTDV